MRGTKLGAVRNPAIESSSKCCLDEMLIKELQNKQEKFVTDLNDFVKGGHYVEELSNQNIEMSETLNQRTLKILSFANSVVKFEDSLNEREGNALRLLAEPEMTYTNLKPMVEELEAANKTIESTHKSLPTEALRKELMELSTEVSKLEAENTIREMKIKLRNEKLELRNRLEIKKARNLSDIKVPEIENIEYKADFSDESKRFEKIQAKIDQIIAQKLKNQDLKDKIDQIHQQEEEVLKKYNEDYSAQRQKVQKLLEELKMYNTYHSQIDALNGKLNDAQIDSLAISDDAFQAAKIKSYIDGAEDEMSSINLDDERNSTLAEREMLSRAREDNNKSDKDKQALEDEVLALEAEIEAIKTKVEQMEAQCEKYQNILENGSEE